MVMKVKRELTEEIKAKLRDEVYNFIAEECEMEVSEINDELIIMEDLDGDSLMFVELVEMLKSEYDFDIQLQVVGKYLLKNPADTVGEVIETMYLIYQYDDKIVDL